MFSFKLYIAAYQSHKIVHGLQVIPNYFQRNIFVDGSTKFLPYTYHVEIFVDTL